MITFCEHENDLREITKIHLDSIQQTYSDIFVRNYLESLCYSDYLRKWQGYFRKEDRRILLYIAGNVIAGFAAVRFYIDEPGCGILDYLHVRSNYQHRGIGTQLISACACVLADIGCRSMQIGVISGNIKAESLYTFLGAKYIGSFQKKQQDMLIIHKRYIWEKLDGLLDGSITDNQDYKYDTLLDFLDHNFNLFGAGEYCKAFLQQFPHLIPENIFDNDHKKWGIAINDIKICAPYRTNNIIITSCHYQEIEYQLCKMGCQNIAKFYPWHKYNPVTHTTIP